MSLIVGKKTEHFVKNFIGKRINSPEQRLIQGATALMLQPTIDYCNKKADNETRAVSVARTIGKIVAGTIVGVSVRYLSIYGAKQFSRFIIEENGKFISAIKRKSKKDILLPKFQPNFYDNLTKEEFLNKYDNTIKTIGTIFATIAMLFTNFLIDAPFTKFITKHLTPKIKAHIDKKSQSEVKNAKD